MAKCPDLKHLEVDLSANHTMKKYAVSQIKTINVQSQITESPCIRMQRFFYVCTC